ncbi:MAG: DUF1877 family protein [Ferruginibacter sp.]
MSQSATLYRISKDNFEKLKESEPNSYFDIGSVKSYVTFPGSFMGLEFILSKGRDKSTIALVNAIFNSRNILGQEKYDSLPPEQKFEFYESGQLIPYINLETISKLDKLLNTVTENEIHLNYNAKELNENGIYPGVWHNDNTKDKAYNERDIMEGVADLKTIIGQAARENDFILVFIG